MMTIRNNVFSKISSAGYALYNYNHAFANSDFNNLYTANCTSLYYSQFPTAGVQTTLQAIRNMNTELNSIVHDPGFTSSTNLQPDATNPASWSLQGRGEHASFNTTDINGNTRVTTKGAGVPDIGAYEFTPSVLPPDATAIPAAR